MSEEIINKLNTLAVQRHVMTESYEKLFEENKNNAAKLVAELNGIKVGDIIETEHRNKKAIIRKIEANFFYPAQYNKRPKLTVSFLKKDGTPRADCNRLWHNWSKVND